MLQTMCLLVLAPSAAFLADLILGDPLGRFHPVCLIGALIGGLEKWLLRESDTPNIKRIKGGILTFLVIIITGLCGGVILWLCYKAGPWWSFAGNVIICWSLLAVKSMHKAAMAVYEPLSAGDLPKARHEVSMIVGRDTENLTEVGVVKAAVESVAESTADGIIAPMFYMGLLGPMGALLYKACNTMDSMIGYKNDRYRNFGTAAARTDDVVNFIPSRLCALLMIVSSFVLRYDYRHAAAVFKRDRFNHASPNSAQTESVCAGALDIRLAGDAVYFGKTVKKPYIGDDLKAVEFEDIRRSVRLMYGTAVGGVLVMTLMRFIILWLILCL